MLETLQWEFSKGKTFLRLLPMSVKPEFKKILNLMRDYPRKDHPNPFETFANMLSFI